MRCGGWRRSWRRRAGKSAGSRGASWGPRRCLAAPYLRSVSRARRSDVENDRKTADYPVVKLTIGLGCALVLGTLLGISFSSWRSERNDMLCDTLTLTGDITPQVFFEAKDCL